MSIIGIEKFIQFHHMRYKKKKKKGKEARNRKGDLYCPERIGYFI